MANRLRGLRGTFSGERCFVMGNGPSLNNMDLELLKDEYVWCSNKVYLLFDRISWRPSFYLAVDRRVVPDISPKIEMLTSELPHTMFFLPSLFRENGNLMSVDNIYWYRETKWNLTNIPDSTFTRDASKWVATVNTVTIAAIQLAVHLGFNPIYLIGCDTSYTVPPTVVLEKNDWRKLVSTADDDPNHFDPTYFGKGSKWHDPQVDRMIYHYEQSKIVLESLGVNVFNATVGGNLEVFPRVAYETLFKVQ